MYKTLFGFSSFISIYIGYYWCHRLVLTLYKIVQSTSLGITHHAVARFWQYTTVTNKSHHVIKCFYKKLFLQTEHMLCPDVPLISSPYPSAVINKLVRQTAKLSFVVRCHRYRSE